MIENNDIFFISEHDERLTHFRNIVVGTLQPVSSSPADLSGKKLTVATFVVNNTQISNFASKVAIKNPYSQRSMHR